jgi:hypothetical protein
MGGNVVHLDTLGASWIWVIHLTLLVKPPAKAPPERSTQLLAVQFHWCHAKGCRPWLRSEPCWWSMVLSGWLLQQQQMVIAPEFAVALCPLPWTWKRQSIESMDLWMSAVEKGWTRMFSSILSARLVYRKGHDDMMNLGKLFLETGHKA